MTTSKTDRELLASAAEAAGVAIRFGTDDDDAPFATVMWLSSGPVITGCRFNRVLQCDNAAMAAVAIEMAAKDPARKAHAH